MAVQFFPFSVSIQGASHARREQEAENLAAGRKFPCQDRSFAEQCAFGGRKGKGGSKASGSYYIACACDGHGSAAYFRSGTGAHLAVESLRSCVADRAESILSLAVKSSEEADAALKDLARAVVGDWCARVDSDFAAYPVEEKEWGFLEQDDAEAFTRYREGRDLRSIYGTTALACVVGPASWFALQIGDGDVVLHTEDKGFFKPIPEDERLFLNQTTSLCDADAAEEFRVACGGGVPDMMLCSTDGIANCFAGDRGLFEFYGKLLWLFRDWDGDEDGGNGEENEDEADTKAAVGGSDGSGSALSAIVGRLKSLSRSGLLPDLQSRFDAALEELKKSLPDIGRRGSGDDLSLAGYVGIDPVKVRDHLKYRSLVAQGREAEAEGKRKKAADCYRKAGENGYPQGWYLLGCLYRDVEMRDEAQTALEKAAEQGVQEAREPLAALLCTSAQEKQEKGDHQAAFEAFSKAALYGNARAQYELGMYYGSPQSYPGCNVRQNFARAVEWTLSAARQGHPDAECKMGKCYRDGRGVQKDAQLSLEWYKKAAAHGSREAKEYLAGFSHPAP